MNQILISLDTPHSIDWRENPLPRTKSVAEKCYKQLGQLPIQDKSLKSSLILLIIYLTKVSQIQNPGSAQNQFVLKTMVNWKNNLICEQPRTKRQGYKHICHLGR